MAPEVESLGKPKGSVAGVMAVVAVLWKWEV